MSRPQLFNTYENRGDVTAIFTDRGEEILVSTVDVPMVAVYTWCLSYVTGKDGRFAYAKTNVKNKEGRITSLYMHRLVCGNPKGKKVDHIDPLRTTDNTRQNVRAATNSENGENRQGANRNSKTGIRGVSLAPNGRYRVKVRSKYYGVYATAEEAKEVAERVRRETMPFSKEAREYAEKMARIVAA